MVLIGMPRRREKELGFGRRCSWAPGFFSRELGKLLLVFFVGFDNREVVSIGLAALVSRVRLLKVSWY